jgi:ribosomal protein L37E
MKCNVCGHGWHASPTYCPRCGAPVLKNNRHIFWEALWVSLALALLFWLTKSR